jgi:LmbE family N-acetylglucosaminyl deacetylase
VTVVCLSFGERGESAKLWKQPDITLDKVKSVRRAEAEKAAQALGVHELHCFDLGDYPLRLTDEDKYRLVGVIRAVQPAFMLSHSAHDPYNTDHMYATQVALETRMIAQAWGHNPGQKVLGAPQLYLFEPHQTEQMGWKPDTFLDITEVWDRKCAAIECRQEHLWELLHPRRREPRQPLHAQLRRPVGRAQGEVRRRLPVDLPADRGRIVIGESDGMPPPSAGPRLPLRGPVRARVRDLP